MKKKLGSAFGFITMVMMFITAVVFAASVPVPDTGQITCYDNTGIVITCPSPGQPFYGQDGSFSINSPSYTKLDGSGNALPVTATAWVMVKDNVTGLIWEGKTNKDGKENFKDPHDSDNKYFWYDSNPETNGGNAGTPREGTDSEDFLKTLNDAKYGGYSDWRLPTIKELSYIVNYSVASPGPTIYTSYFINTQPSKYWSATTSAHTTTYAWGMDFSSSDDFDDYKLNGNSSYYVRAVRGRQSGSDDASIVTGGYMDNGNGTVTDTYTSLIWQQAGSLDTKTWQQALEYCEELNLGNHTDWRLPTTKELRSLVDYSHYTQNFPSINADVFPNTVLNYYWTGTTKASQDLTSRAWYVGFSKGSDSYTSKNDKYYVRAVRGGQAICTPDLKANGQDGQITVSTGTPVSITASLEPGNENGKNADWWLAYSSSAGWYSFNSNGWSPGINVLFQSPLFSISPAVVIYSSTLPVGDYAFYFLVDMSPNGIIDSPFYYDSVQVHVTK